jgi:hypothetical protein
MDPDSDSDADVELPIGSLSAEAIQHDSMVSTSASELEPKSSCRSTLTGHILSSRIEVCRQSLAKAGSKKTVWQQESEHLSDRAKTSVVDIAVED